ncbi:MAG: transketolase [Calditrichaeota bacterium]|nr:transketolase [Calditrichota bacterium]
MKRNNTDTEKLAEIANRIRIKVVKMIAQSGTGHLGGSSSIAEILTVLYFRIMRFDPRNPEFEDRDRFVLSKGHASPALYATFSEVGFISEDLLSTVHQIDSPLQMHPERGLCPGVEMSTGALGQGLSAGVGMAIGAKLKKKSLRIYVLIGDGEAAEGQIWEAAMSAPNYKLDNLTAILDYNKFALSDRVDKVMSLEPVSEKWIAFGWHVIEVNGHSIHQLIDAFERTQKIKNKPTIIIAHTVKGYKIPYYEDQAFSHSVSFTEEQVKKALSALGCSVEEISETVQQMKGRE